MIRPDSAAAVRDALLDSAGTVLIRGGGTKVRGAALERVDLVLETTALDSLIDHSAGDMTAVVGAGMPLAALQAQLAPSGQWLAIDPSGAAATVGGIYAADDAGPSRHRYGTLRDLAIGVTAVLSDGTVATAGGRVVKNVAGFDLVRLLCGSLGTLAVVTELVVRLHPLPETSCTVRLQATPQAATDVMLRLLSSPIVPSAVDYHDGQLLVRLRGRPQGVAAQKDDLRALVRAMDVARDATFDELDGADEDDAWAAAAAAHHGADGQTLVRITSVAGRLAAVADAVDKVARAGGITAELSSHAGVGVHSVRLSGGTAAAHAAGVAALRQRVAGLGSAAVVHRRIDGVDDLVDPWGLEPPAVAVMRRVKARLDPARRLAPGRFIGGI